MMVRIPLGKGMAVKWIIYSAFVAFEALEFMAGVFVSMTYIVQITHSFIQIDQRLGIMTAAIYAQQPNVSPISCLAQL